MKNLIFKIKSLRHAVCLKYYHTLPLQANKLLFWSNSFHSYGDSPKYIAEYLNQNFPGKYDLVWVFETGTPIPDDLPDGIRVVRYFSIDYLKEISTAKFIICNARTGPYHYFNKRNGQIYIQTWHSSLRLKMIEGDAPSLPESYVNAAKADSEKIDLLLSGCGFSTEIFRRAFWYDGEIMQGGTPRCDLFFGDRSKVRQKVFDHYGISADSKLALYAPTFRDSKIAQTHGLDFKKLSAALAKSENADWVIGCRYHPNLKDAAVPDGSVSMTAYPDMQELIAAADILITDYSSCMFDMAIKGDPCVLYAPDIKEYTARERNLYFDLESLPFPVARNMDELVSAVESFDREEYRTKVHSFLDSVGNSEDGHAAERVAEYIEKKAGINK